jgi:hypothetical protein
MLGTFRRLALYGPGRLLWIEKQVRQWSGPELRRRWRSARWLAILAIGASWLGIGDELLRSVYRSRPSRLTLDARRGPSDDRTHV